MAVGVVPAHQSPLIADFFASQRFTDGALPNLATAASPRDGFSPTRLSNGTNVLFLPTPNLLPSVLGNPLTPLWENGLGLVLYQHPEAQVLGAVFLHGAIQNEWNAIQNGAYQCLGGIMLFSDHAREAKSDLSLIGDVVRKSTAMTTKWMFIDGNLQGIEHSMLTNLGGGKSTASHPAGDKGRRDAVQVTASVARELGIYISGADQNMNAGLCNFFSTIAPHNFMGATQHAEPSYGGMGDPSPLTARGVFEAIKTSNQKLFGDRKAPIFFQGYGNVGAPVVRFAIEGGHSVAGIIDIDIEKLIQARRDGIQGRLFLQAVTTVTDEIREKAGEYDISIVPSLTAALEGSPDAAIFSPNAGPHPLTEEVVDYLTNSEIRAVVGAANNVFDTIDGSIEPLARKLQARGVFAPNDSETNQMGALSVTVQRIGLNADGLIRAAINVGSLTELSWEAFQRGIPPQIARDKAAKQRFNRLVREGRAVGGPFPGVDETPAV